LTDTLTLQWRRLLNRRCTRPQLAQVEARLRLIEHAASLKSGDNASVYLQRVLALGVGSPEAVAYDLHVRCATFGRESANVDILYPLLEVTQRVLLLPQILKWLPQSHFEEYQSETVKVEISIVLLVLSSGELRVFRMTVNVERWRRVSLLKVEV
jgi:hypothetical protein